MICVHCDAEFTPFAGKPGKINECVDCAVDVPTYRAEQSEDEDGNVFNIEKNPVTREKFIIDSKKTEKDEEDDD